MPDIFNIHTTNQIAVTTMTIFHSIAPTAQSFFSATHR